MSAWIVSELDDLQGQLAADWRSTLEKAFEEGIRHGLDPEGDAWFFIKDGRLKLNVTDPTQFAERAIDVEEAALWICCKDLTSDDEGKADVRATGALLRQLGERLETMELPHEDSLEGPS